LTDITGILDGAGNQIASYTYDSWGKLVSIGGVLADSVGVKNPYRYRGYRYDTETGLYYLQSRYYNPEWGRFLNADAIAGAVGDLLGANVYAYADGNPIMKSDTTGHMAESALFAGSFGGGAAGSGGIGIGTFLIGGFVLIANGTLRLYHVVVNYLQQSKKTLQSPQEPPAPVIHWPEDASTPPGPGFQWRGGEKGGWYNPGTGVSVRPDLGHEGGIGPHYDVRERNSKRGWRLFPDGQMLPK
jgi:RHS repeat-associated protein